MTPIPLGILAASAAGPGSDFELISSISLSSLTQTVSFTSIPSNFAHLQLRIVAKQGGTNTSEQLIIRVDEEEEIYNYRQLIGNGTGSATGYSNEEDDEIRLCSMPSNLDASGGWVFSVVDFVDFFSTKKLSLFSFSGFVGSSTQQSTIVQGHSQFSLAKNSIQVGTRSTGRLAAGTRISLYGRKA